MGYRRLTLAERYQIGAFKKSGQSVRQIGQALGRSASSISRELNRNGGWMGYSGAVAHSQARSRRRDCCAGPPRKLQGNLERLVRANLQKHWSPEQISGRLKMKKLGEVSYFSIYRYVYRDAQNGGDLWLSLRTQRNKRKRQKSSVLRDNFKSLKNVRRINERPKVVEKKNRLGDFERDLIQGSRPGAVILTINDRVSRKLKIGWLPKKSSKSVHLKTVRLLRKERKVRTLTNDNGSEFARHRDTERSLKTRVFFSNKGCAWERGANENTNGLLRQYFPRNMNFEKITRTEIRKAERLLNSRPRKCLGYYTPTEVHQRLGQVLH